MTMNQRATSQADLAQFDQIRAHTQQLSGELGRIIVGQEAIVRSLLVPATMRLLGGWNWWAPRWMPGTHRGSR